MAATTSIEWNVILMVPIPLSTTRNTGCSMVITDPKGEILRKTGGFLKQIGYEVRVFDLLNPDASFCYNPFRYADELFRKIKSEPYDKSIEHRIRQQDAEHNRQKQAAEKKIKAAQYKQQRYEDEVLKCLEGKSAFSQEMLARLIAQAEAEVRQAKDEYATLLQNNDHRATVQQIRDYYNEFLGWANEFDLASIPRNSIPLIHFVHCISRNLLAGFTVHLF